MKKIFKGLGLGLVALALSLSLTTDAGAATTFAVNAITESGALTITTTGSVALTVAPGTAAGTIVLGKSDQTGTNMTVKN